MTIVRYRIVITLINQLPVSILLEDSSFERVGKRLPVEAHGGRGREVFRFEIVRTGSSVRESE
jgi:hypothetical protein